jgi:hypothetical protein
MIWLLNFLLFIYLFGYYNFKIIIIIMESKPNSSFLEIEHAQVDLIIEKCFLSFFIDSCIQFRE